MTLNKVNMVALLQFAIDRKTKEEEARGMSQHFNGKSCELAAWEAYLDRIEQHHETTIELV